MGYIVFSIVTLVIPPPDINISRKQYDEASTTWRTQGVQEYEMIVDYQLFNPALRGLWRLLVHSEGGVDKIAGYSRIDSQLSIYGFADDLNSLTVADSFYMVQNMISSQPNESGFGYPKYYIVQFDPVLGYPVRLESHPRSRYVFDQDWSVTVKSLKILKRKTPVP